MFDYTTLQNMTLCGAAIIKEWEGGVPPWGGVCFMAIPGTTFAVKYIAAQPKPPEKQGGGYLGGCPLHTTQVPDCIYIP